jgi:D-xylose reductase
VKREDLFIVSKLWNTFHDGDKVEPICKKQLADWGIDYFDLYLIHFPVALAYVDPSVRYPPGWHYDGVAEIRPSKASIQETWTAMEGLVSAGLAKSIGISNFQGQLVYDLLRYCKIRPATLQIEHHPYLVQQELLNICKEEKIAVTAYSSFGTLSFAEFNMKHAGALKPLMETDVITSLASKYGKEPSQILLRWSTQRGLAVIPKTSRANVMATNLDCTSFDIDEEDMAKISAMDKGIRFNQPSNVSHQASPPFSRPSNLTSSIRSVSSVADNLFFCSTSRPKSFGSSAKKQSTSGNRPTVHCVTNFHNKAGQQLGEGRGRREHLVMRMGKAQSISKQSRSVRIKSGGLFFPPIFLLEERKGRLLLS